MTLDEKITLLAAKNVWETPEIDRLGIPSLKVTDGPNGARGGDFFDGTTAACFPACVSLAATFDRRLCRQVGKALGQEAVTKGAYVLLGPTVFCHRSPLGVRNFEAFSEDPFLSGTLASEYVKGLQGERVAATVKHFLANEQDTRRFSVNEIVSERALREIYLKPFEMVAKDAHPWAFMSSYPKINGRHVDAQSKFLIDILRNEWGYDGLVMSDWGAASTVESVKYGLDLVMPGPARQRTPEAVHKALREGLIDTSDIDSRVLATLKLLKQTGKLDDRKDTPKEQAIDRPEHRALIRKAGAEGIVLLKNENNILPIDVAKTKKIALLGPLAKYAAAHGGDSASLNCHYKVSPHDAFTARLGEQMEITHAKGAHIFREYPDMEAGCINSRGNPGFLAEYFMASTTPRGEPYHAERFPRGRFTTLMDTAVVGCQTVRFTLTYSPPVSGKHYLSFSGLGPSKLYIDDVLVAEQRDSIKDAMGFFLGAQEEIRIQHTFVSEEDYSIAMETHPSPYSNSELYLMEGQCSIHLGFIAQAEMEHDVLAEAVALAKEADLVILFVGNTTQWETEGQDLTSMTLPADGSQDGLIATVAAANPNTIVVNTTGVPVELPWLDDVPALVQAWYAGQETGNAILDVLLGENTPPGGKLPMSWPRKYDHTGCHGHFGLDSYASREVEYVEGVFVGYRWFDALWRSERQVLFPFGFGLSYSQFDVGGASIAGSLSSNNHAGPSVSVKARVKNVGARPGSETVQVYLEPPVVQGLGRPVKGLVGFAKVELQTSEEKSIEVRFGRDGAAYWDEEGRNWKVGEGTYKVLIATSSGPEDVKARLEIHVENGFSFGP
ncbi:glycoside hydrolase family 3 protein [Pleomassaria siparia CBS 279.74]|uniref:beta-glucosidase n=1 Tax=Pleomassaria siparia CBS 279.74 TaxID=1314801 RepID=A0A6G1KJK5_9PLEO|nr:glycoside hydrolase family 3 protein [Pleomassaria siparia CBS 279.74]